MRWRTAALLREAALNLWANGARSAVILLIAAAAVGGLGFLELQQADGLREFQDDYAAAGGYVAIVTRPNEPLDTGRCEALQERDGVVAAGSIRGTGTVSFASAPGVLFQSAAVTAGALQVWQPGIHVPPAPEGGSIVAGGAMASELGLATGSYTARAGEEPVLVAAVLRAERRNPQVQRWALDVSPAAGEAAECWVEFDRDAYRAGVDTLAAWFATGTQEPVVRPYFRRDEFTRDPGREFAQRPERFGWLAAGGLIAAVSVLSAWFRRAELGLYLALGTARSQLIGLLAIESALVLGLAAAGGLLWAFALQAAMHHPLPADHAWLAFRSAISGTLLGLVLAPAASALVARGSVAALLKDR
ncbi:MAG: hypothetical protein HY875_14170 [Chloroflexi bacterium]|nr:hypothetical protein [Chloroflexota bacterium]